MKDKTVTELSRLNYPSHYGNMNLSVGTTLCGAAQAWGGWVSRRKHPRQRGGNLSRNALTGRAPVVYSMMSAYGQLRLHPLNTVVYEEMVWYSALDSKTVAALAREVK